MAAAAPQELPARSKTKSAEYMMGIRISLVRPALFFPNLIKENRSVLAGYSKSARNVSAKTKNKCTRSNGLSYPQKTGSYEADHFIPLEIGGSNDIANLFPEAAEPAPGFHEKI